MYDYGTMFTERSASNKSIAFSMKGEGRRSWWSLLV